MTDRRALCTTEKLQLSEGSVVYNAASDERNEVDCAKTGRLIAKLRKEKSLTQQNVADALNISNKAVSKWECGLGYPDVAFWPDLSVILGADIKQMIEGEIALNKPDSGNIDKVRFYACPACNNVLTSTGSASIFCCGRKLEPLVPHEIEEGLSIKVNDYDGEYYLEIDHEMSREHYLLFAAYVKSDKLYVTRLYPEQEAGLYIPSPSGGKLYLYCTEHGFMRHSL